MKSMSASMKRWVALVPALALTWVLVPVLVQVATAQEPRITIDKWPRTAQRGGGFGGFGRDGRFL